MTTIYNIISCFILNLLSLTEPGDPIRYDLWEVNIDCSVPDTISVSIEDIYSGTILIDGVSTRQNYREVLIHCTDGNTQQVGRSSTGVINIKLTRFYTDGKILCVMAFEQGGTVGVGPGILL
jgi:hypothetical protein